MTCAIFYFSGTGNTWWCSQAIARHLTEAGISTEPFSIERLNRAQTAEIVGRSDLIGIGYPIYGSDLPLIVKQFIGETLPPNREARKRLFVFCTQLMFSGDGAHVYERELADRGWTIRWSAHLNMPNNVCVPVSPLPFTNDPEKIRRKLSKAGKTIERFAASVGAKRRYSRGKGMAAAALGYLQRGPFRKAFDSLRNDVTVDAERCTLCCRCVRICPSGNLYVEQGRIETRGTCILCVRCYNFCPVQAVLHRGKRHDNARGVPYRGPSPDFLPEDLAAET